MTKTWRGVSGKYFIECWKDFGFLYDPANGYRLPVPNEVHADTAEITIHFEANGSYDPGCMYLRNGDPGYPPEGDEERLFVAATIREHGSKEEVRLPDDVGHRLFDMYEQQINEVELDYETEDDRD